MNRSKLIIILLAAGAILAGVPLVKSLAELLGAARYNTFGYLQGAMLLAAAGCFLAVILISPTSEAQRQRRLAWLFFFIFFLPIFFDLPRLWLMAEETDRLNGRTINTYGDDNSYQLLAINMLRGQGFVDRMILPPETYHLDLDTTWGGKLLEQYRQGPIPIQEDELSFYRAPGLPLMLTATYAVFGDETLTARRMMAVLAWLTAALLLSAGALLAGWPGAIAGGLAGMYHLWFYPGLYDFTNILTEIPAAFWVALFCLFMVIYTKKNSLPALALAGFSFACLSFVRVNLFLTFPFILGYLWLQKAGWWRMAVFSAVTVLVVGCWSLYASTSLGKLVLFTTQGGREFPSFNNILVLEGAGPDHAGQGGWQAGKIYDENGDWVDSLYYAKPGQNGWLMGFQFWVEHIDDLPRLFYVKLRRGFWNDNGWSVNVLRPEGLHLVAIGYLLLALGLRPPKARPRILASWSSSRVLLLQLGFICALVLIWNQVAFWLVLDLWLAILLIAVLRPYGDALRLSFPAPVWFLVFVLCHAAITMLFTGYRYHWPLDPPLMLFGLLGIVLTVQELLRRKAWLLLPFLGVMGAAGALYLF